MLSLQCIRELDMDHPERKDAFACDVEHCEHVVSVAVRSRNVIQYDVLKGIPNPQQEEQVHLKFVRRADLFRSRQDDHEHARHEDHSRKEQRRDASRHMPIAVAHNVDGTDQNRAEGQQSHIGVDVWSSKRRGRSIAVTSHGEEFDGQERERDDPVGVPVRRVTTARELLGSAVRVRVSQTME